MKKVLFILWPILLILAVAAFLFTYAQYRDKNKALLVSEDRRSDMSKSNSQLEQENSALDEQVQEGLKHRDALISAQNQISKLNDNRKSLSEEITSSQDTVLRMRLEIQQSEHTMNQLEEEMEKKENELEKYRSDLSLLRTQKDEDRALMEQLRSKHDAVVSKLEREIEKKKSELEKDRSDLSLFRTQQDEDRALMEQLRSKHDASASKLRREIEIRDQSIAAFHEELKAEKNREKDVHGALEKAFVDIHELNQKIHERDLRISEIGSSLKKAESEVAILKEEIENTEMRRRNLEQRIQDLFGEKNLLKDQMNQLQSTHESMVSELHNEINKKEVTIEELEDKLSITFVDHILFEFAEASISPAGKQILTRIGKILKNVQNKEIRVVGHTDNVPIAKVYQSIFPSNWELSAARAAAVVRYLQIEIGLDPENLEAVGRSYYDPRTDNETDEGRSKNRRVNIIIAPKIE